MEKERKQAAFLRPLAGFRPFVFALAFFAALLPALGMFFYHLSDLRRQAAAGAEEKALFVLRTASREQERLVLNTVQTLSVLALLPEMHAPGPATSNNILKNLLGQSPWLANVGLLDLKGNLVCSAVPAQGPVNAADRLYFQKVLRTGRPAVGEYAVSRTTGRPALHVAHPVFDERGELRAVLWAALDLAWLANYSLGATLPPGMVFTLADKNGLVLVRVPDGEEWIGRRAEDLPLAEAAALGTEGVRWEKEAKGRPQLTVFRPVALPAEDAAVFAFVGASNEAVFAAANTILLHGGAAAGLAGVSALAVLAFGGLAAFFFRRAEKELRESEEKYRAVFENTGTATIIIEEDTTISLANAGFCALTGYSREEVEGRMSWKDFVAAEEDLQKMVEYHYLRRRDPGAAPRNYEASIRDRQGAVRQVSITVAVIPGTAKSVASSLDITEAKRAYARQAALAEERGRLYAEARRRNQQLRALRSIDTAITASLDLHLTFEVILDQAVNRLGADAAAVLLLNQSTHRLEYAAGRGFSGAQGGRAPLRLGEGGAGLAAMEGRLVSIPDLAGAKGSCPRLDLLGAEGFVSYWAVPLVARGQVKGVLEVFRRSSFEADPDWLEFLETIGRQAAVAVDGATLFASLQRANRELTLAYDETIEALAYALDLRDRETEGHSRRVADLTLELARACGMGEEEMAHVRRGSLLHDVGKLGVPDAILLKPGPLTEEEWEIMRRHPVYAYEMLSPIGHLRPALDIPYCHHEKWDGTGYPRGLKGKQIPLAARLFAVVDVWDALLSERPYRPPWPREKTLAYLREQSGKHFDPEAVAAFLKIIG